MQQCLHLFSSLQIDASTSQEEINNIVDDPSYLSIVNSSGWPASRCITMQSKSAFLHGLIVSEFSKRIPLIKSFAKDLNVLKVFDAVTRNPDQMRHVFVHNEDEVLTSQKFIGAIKSRRPTDEVKRQVFDWFMEYIQMKGSQGIHCNVHDYVIECLIQLFVARAYAYSQEFTMGYIVLVY